MGLFDSIIGELYSASKLVEYYRRDKSGPLNLQDEGKHTVLIIPGFMEPLWFVRGLAERLKKDDYHPIRWSHPSRQRLEQNVDNIAQQIEEDFGKTGKKISLYGHSLGGLISRDLMNHVPELIETVVLSGTPNYGTNVAKVKRFIPFADRLIGSAKDMIPGSDYLRKLNSFPLPPEIPITNLVSKHDQLVFPWENALLPNVNNVDNIENIIIEDGGHLALTGKLVFEFIVKGLNKGSQ